MVAETQKQSGIKYSYRSNRVQKGFLTDKHCIVSSHSHNAIYLISNIIY